ncbi:MAG: fumarylacetoacetate hydrolase family protein [Dehalococcoidia bacterium]|jgi:2-keto-4-pentenoate hydratase/2-oxohepta-3-ene-1,7-dioic acid hydratase in catechol pathway|nr:fumarylacetoacetate hydrolase family protein [Dehalococcoidia bacterium]
MRLAYVRHRGIRHNPGSTAAVVEGSQVKLVRGGPLGRYVQTGETAPLSDVQLLSPVPRPSKIVAIGINYQTHAGEGTAPAQPEPFLKAPSSLIGHEQTILLPPDAERVDAEAEVVAVIGRRARNISEAEADRHIAGYTCGNDVSARDWQRGDLQWWRAKSADTFTAAGPWIETELGPEDLHLVGRLNGKIVQDASTTELVHSIRKCIAYISRAMTLEPGDMVFTGTPGTTVQLHAGDVFEVEVAGVGVLRNPVEAAPEV